jgi:type V secretory pathway adhesin AidA
MAGTLAADLKEQIRSITAFDSAGNFEMADLLIRNVTGFSVMGSITSHNPQIPINLTLTGEDDVVSELTIPVSAGSGMVVQEFEFIGVQPGDYVLRVTKASHLSYTKLLVRVGDTDLSLTEIVLIPGDINGDGQINFSDLSLLLNDYGKTGTGLFTDLNGDGQVNFNDLSLLLSSYGKTRTIEP